MKNNNWTICLICKGRGKINKGIRKKLKLRYQRALAQFEKNNQQGDAPIAPRGHLEDCAHCKGSGLVASFERKEAFSKPTGYPHIAIIGGGIGGVALAVACLHRDIPFTLYERDSGFDARSQGYGLTLQQASKAIEGLGLFDLNEGVVSTKHVVHDTQGNILGEWGMRKWMQSSKKASPKRTNIHIARQSLRLALIEQLGGHDCIKWNHQLVDLKDNGSQAMDLRFNVNGERIQATADLVVGADGIRSQVRQLIIDEQQYALRYLGCIVILGICPLDAIQCEDRTLLDSATVFQSANGNERIYIMPYDANSVMWQLSFPLAQSDAKLLSEKGSKALKQEAINRCQWHEPIPQILEATEPDLVSGYPVYDRALLKPEHLKADKVTLIGDAAHPMSPFKGQGANQALLDALALAREIKRGCRTSFDWKQLGIRENVLTEFESQMLQRSAVKVKDSADAAAFLHSDVVLVEGNEPRGRCLKNKDKPS